MNVNEKKFFTENGAEVLIQSDYNDDIEAILMKNRGLNPHEKNVFFQPKISDLHNPFLMPDIEKAITRILQAVENSERIVIFGDYDVDGVSATALLVRFLFHELGAEVSYRLPHRIHDGYGLKSYFFDDLKEKNVTLVITVDCGTRDIEPIQYAKSLGIDVIVTDHHAVPDVIPTEVIGILNPKRSDSKYPFSSLAGAGVALKLIHGILLTREKNNANFHGKTKEILTKYIDFASLGTVADCMPLIDENRIITTLWLKQMKQSESAWLRKFLQWKENIDGNADIIGFQIGPRINASGRMDTPLTALRWLLASEKTCDNFLEEIENLNTERRSVVENFKIKALESVNPENPILFFFEKTLEHGLIGLVAGKLTEQYNRVSIVLCEHREASGETSYVASCRAPEWCNIMDLLDDSKELFIRYWGHKQAAGFSIFPENFEKLQEKMIKKFHEIFGKSHLPHPIIRVESTILPEKMHISMMDSIEKFRPFGIENPKPLWLLENVTIRNVVPLWAEGKHIKIFLQENPEVPMILWNGANEASLIPWNRVSLIVYFEKNIWNNTTSLQAFIKNICQKTDSY